MDKIHTAFNTFEPLKPLPDLTVDAMAYIPFQTDKTVFDEETALNKGTLFCVLNKPFCRGMLK